MMGSLNVQKGKNDRTLQYVTQVFSVFHLEVKRETSNYCDGISKIELDSKIYLIKFFLFLSRHTRQQARQGIGRQFFSLTIKLTLGKTYQLPGKNLSHSNNIFPFGNFQEKVAKQYSLVKNNSVSLFSPNIFEA